MTAPARGAAPARRAPNRAAPARSRAARDRDARPGRGRASPRLAAVRRVAAWPEPRHGPAALRGLLWGAVVIVAAWQGPVAVAVVVVPVAAVAAASAERAWNRGDRRPGQPPLPIAAAVAGLVPVVALGGLAAAAVALATGVAILAATAAATPAPAGLLQRVVVTAAPAAAGAALVTAVHQNADTGMVLVVGTCLYDFAVFMFGRGPTGGILGIAAGVVTLAVLAVFAAAVMVPPFTGRSPWITVGSLAVFGPAGVVLLRRLAPARLPALLRLDSLALAGPVWVVAVAVLLHP